MDASERISWTNCLNCGGLVAVAWRDEVPVGVDCIGGCLLRVEQVQPSSARNDSASSAPAGMLGDVAEMAAILEDAVLQTAEAYGLTDPREAAALVAGAWADILCEERRSPRLIELATTAVREVGDQLHRRQIPADPPGVRDASTDIRVLVVDDHPLARLRLVEMFAGEADFDVVGQCENGSQVVEAAGRLRPHVVCMDRSLPTTDDPAATEALRVAQPGVRIVLLTGDSAARREMARAGADALVPREAGRDALLHCLRAVARRGTDCPYCL